VGVGRGVGDKECGERGVRPRAACCIAYCIIDCGAAVRRLAAESTLLSISDEDTLFMEVLFIEEVLIIEEVLLIEEVWALEMVEDELLLTEELLLIVDVSIKEVLALDVLIIEAFRVDVLALEIVDDAFIEVLIVEGCSSEGEENRVLCLREDLAELAGSTLALESAWRVRTERDESALRSASQPEGEVRKVGVMALLAVWMLGQGDCIFLTSESGESI